MEPLPAELMTWLEHSRAWPTLPRVGVFLEHVEASLRETFDIDMGCIVLARSGRMPGSSPQPPAVEAYWGFPDQDRATFEAWFAQDPTHALDRLFSGGGRWHASDEIPDLLRPYWQRWGLSTMGRWTIEPFGGDGGAMVLGRTRPHADDAQVIGLCANLVALVLELIVQRRVAEEESNRDALTGLWNRRGVFAQMPRMLASARRHGEQLVVGVVDVNSLKRVNDAAGHQAGDRALREVAQALRSAVRGDDLVARWGGDEFVLLFQAHARAARSVARRLMAWTEQRSGYRVSIGCAVWGVDGDDWETLFEVADRRCYRVKRFPAERHPGPRRVLSR